jgi:hypothetical protein
MYNTGYRLQVMEEALYRRKWPSLELLLYCNDVANIRPLNIDIRELGTDYRKNTKVGAYWLFRVP